MKSVRYLLMGLAMVLAVLGAGGVSASGFLGNVILVGTFSEEFSDGFHARLRVRVNGTCDNDPVRGLYFIIRSGRVDGAFAHNGVNMKNAYSTLLAALLSGKGVEIQDGFPYCIPNERNEIFMDLWRGSVSLFPAAFPE